VPCWIWAIENMYQCRLVIYMNSKTSERLPSNDICLISGGSGSKCFNLLISIVPCMFHAEWWIIIFCLETHKVILCVLSHQYVLGT
jgi:hypothetical protein